MKTITVRPRPYFIDSTEQGGGRDGITKLTCIITVLGCIGNSTVDVNEYEVRSCPKLASSGGKLKQRVQEKSDDITPQMQIKIVQTSLALLLLTCIDDPWSHVPPCCDRRSENYQRDLKYWESMEP